MDRHEIMAKLAELDNNILELQDQLRQLEKERSRVVRTGLALIMYSAKTINCPTHPTLF